MGDFNPGGNDPEKDIVEEAESTSHGISTGQWIMLGTLGVLGVLAPVLALVAARRVQTTGPTGAVIPDGDEAWMVSMRHLAQAIDYRFLGLESKIEDLGALMGVPVPPPPAPVDRTFAPSPEPVSMSGVPVGAEEPPPPGPAATSLPPNADN